MKLAEQLSLPGILVEVCTVEEKKQAQGSKGSLLVCQGVDFSFNTGTVSHSAFQGIWSVAPN